MSILNRPFTAEYYAIKQCPFVMNYSLQNIILSSNVSSQLTINCRILSNQALSILNQSFIAAYYPIKQCWYITNDSMWNIIKVFLYPSAFHVLLFYIKYHDQTMEYTHPNVVFLERKLLMSIFRNALCYKCRLITKVSSRWNNEMFKGDEELSC